MKIKTEMKIKTFILALFIGLYTISTVEAQDYAKVNELTGLKIGEKAPTFVATQANGETFKLEEALKSGPVVMIFYRGEWCPYCNRHLSNLQDSSIMIKEAGATLIAISPQKQEYLKKMETKTGAGFTLLHDKGFKISDDYKGTFKPSFMQRLMYNMIGAKLRTSASDSSKQLPVPATYVINKEGIIIWRHFNQDYTQRSTAAEILKALEE